MSITSLRADLVRVLFRATLKSETQTETETLSFFVLGALRLWGPGRGAYRQQRQLQKRPGD